VTFKDLQKAVESTQSGPKLNSIPRDKAFWIWDQQQHKRKDIRTKGQCCFWHIIKCSQKDGHDMPVLPYQRILYDALQNHKRIAILKARGIGITTFLVRYIAWCCLNKYERNSRVLILTGPRIQLSQDLIARSKHSSHRHRSYQRQKKQ
jgi:predicted NACHT family NTPase